MKTKRIDFLDGLRGVAILLVILFHAYARWPEIVPYGNQFLSFPVFKYGFLGVELFFLISGFVILMSLEKSGDFKSFIYKRWVRLFPAMLIATALVYFSLPFFHERPYGISKACSIIPGLLFVEPSWIKAATGFEITPIEGAFWSLFVEMKFYFIFGISYFLFGKSKAIMGLIALFFASIVFDIGHIKYLDKLASGMSLTYFGWFASGCLAYMFYTGRQAKHLVFSLLIAGVEMLRYRNDLLLLLFAGVITAIFMLPVCIEKCKGLISNKFLLFLGFVSYPLYLIHENAMISMVVKLHTNFSIIPSFLLPVVPVLLLCAVAFVIADKVEPACRKLIIGLIKNSRSLIQKTGFGERSPA